MKGLLIKDLYSIRQYLKSILLILAFFALFSIGLGDSAILLEGMIVMFFMMMTIYSFSADNLAKWDRYALSLPISRLEIVTSKYILSFFLCLTGTLLSLILVSAVLAIKPLNNFDFTDHLLATASIFAISIFFSSVLLPLIFKFGVEKSRMFLILIFAIPSASVIVLDKIGLKMPTEGEFLSFFKLIPIIILILLLVSYLVSLKIYTNKEI